MEKEKVLGYLLLIAGIAVIAYAGFSVYQVFTNKVVPEELFAFGPISMDLSKLVENAPTDANLTQELVKSEVLNKPMNLVAHLLLMGFVTTIGFKFASLGTMLIRPIKVNLKESAPVDTSKSSSVPPWK